MRRTDLFNGLLEYMRRIILQHTKWFHEFINDNFGKDIILDTIYHIVYTTKELKVVKGRLMENERIICKSELIDVYFK